MDAAVFIILAIVVLTALAFDFTNGFHDTGNAMATSIATKALKPFNAVALSAALNVVGAFLSVHVAATVASGIVDLGSYNLDNPQEGLNLLIVVFAALIGAILWNLLTWLLGLPSSSSHALFGGMIGAAFAAMGSQGVEWSSIVGKIVIPALASPVIAALVSATATFLIYWVTNTIPNRRKVEHFRHGQIITASLISLAHGAGDAQKTMGIIFLALIATGNATETQRVPVWVIVVCALAIALGTLSGGWRVIRTLGKGLVEIEAPQGMAAEATSAAIILTSAAGGMALSTTHVATGAIIGTGLGKKGSKVRWGVAKRMVSAWVITLPCAGLVGYATWWIAALFGQVHPLIGVLVDLALLLTMVGIILVRSHQDKVDANNVNEDWSQDSKASESAQQATPLEVEKALEQDIEEILGASMDATAASVQIPNVSRREHIQRLREERLELAARLRDIERELEEILFADESLVAPQHDSTVQDLVTATPHQVAASLPPADVVRPDSEDK
ncbi:anion permease [Mobiluncus mulieris]|uniref:Phosphate transporter n=2 Tax=Mobiluncus mulieris TaxID=2052 RepID=E0QMJ8_9ACTO|nr:inorganic phosphate transporter [Mobiluncus mulieris]EEJ53139.1 phosphate transporter family protein [Mobiluncus mulieris ATCC 35243]EFM47252.1 phosphate transporter family protein [Mobiluncus mulieris ATCC 35239]EFN93590.1 phosphate transporter family protein [Mobiluncus mulieris FB024-16]MBB5847375.1 PiT family inorganic phosphate transporter [Mobiluncus mulieris]MCU9971512.1 anion permease [Mobiluncus mulieris]